MFQDCEDLQKHYRRFHRPSRKFYVKETAFNRNFITYRYNFNQDEKNFENAQLRIKNLIQERLLSESVEKTVCKASLIFIVEMSMTDHAGEKMTTISIPFRASAFLSSPHSQRTLNKNILRSFSIQSQAMEEFIKSGSGWVFQRPLAFDIEIAAVKPITGGSEKVSTEIFPKLNLIKFRQKQFLYSPCNKDEKCFLYCIAHFLYADKILKTNVKEKDEKKYKKYIKKFDTKNISFPISINGIKRFLKQNKNLDIKINILYRNTKDRIFPMEYGLGEGKKIVNLLMVEKKILITSF
jgi:hypothetical protein